MFSSLADAIELSRKAIREGKEIFVFPADLKPSEFLATLSEENSSWSNYNSKVTNINSSKHSSRRTKSKERAYRD